ncbi:MAG: type I-E CRISPR-associated protein Cas7/Cse4/CasC [Armatimonadota bacterium]
MLVQIHLIQNHAPSNLNRDDTGSPKEALFGGVMRARISSQCLKRSIRQSEIFQEALCGHLGMRTRRFPSALREVLLQQGCATDVAEVIARKATLFGSDKESTDATTRQLIFLGAGEVEGLATQLKALHDKDPKAFAKMKLDEIEGQLQTSLPRSVDIALFGRMTTSAAFEDVQAAAQVAHAISTHKVERQFDYFTAVDDLKSNADEDKGAGMIGDVEFNSATYYKYFAIDVDALAETLGGDRETALAAVGAFLTAAALVSPTGKQNTFAAHNPPDAIVVEVSESHVPVSYANAFVKPVRSTAEQDLVAGSIARLQEYAQQVNRMYGLRRTVYCLTTAAQAWDAATPVSNLQELVERLSTAGQVTEVA